jgi:molybdopterin/thiamine biosynthesis adenylyltransferase/rhodanese-related sulfurtransferase
MSKYARQIMLPEVGEEGQKKLTKTHVLCVGAGGLAAPVLQYLVGAGIGHITLVDADTISESNLHRQVLFDTNSIGYEKSVKAAASLMPLNPDCQVTALVDQVGADNVAKFVASADIVLDCADSFAASYILSDACYLAGKPLISASVLGLSGYVAGFCAGAPSLRAVFPDLPSRAATCATAGVLGPIVGVIGAMQAQMALAVALELSPSPLGQLLNFDAAHWRSSGFRFDGAAEPVGPVWRFISRADITPADFVAELRDSDEAPEAVVPFARRASADDFGAEGLRPAQNQRAVLCCKSGLRAYRAAQKLSQNWQGEIVLLAQSS